MLTPWFLIPVRVLAGVCLGLLVGCPLVVLICAYIKLIVEVFK